MRKPLLEASADRSDDFTTRKARAVRSITSLQRAVGNRAMAGLLESSATRGPGVELPHLEQIQRSFGGHDVSRAVAHVDEAAAKRARSFGAAAYTLGNHVAFDGQPSLAISAHEAAHVVQQRAGVSLFGGIGSAGDAYEQQADAVSARVVQGRSAEDLLGPARDQAGSSVPAVQCKILLGGKPYEPTVEDWQTFNNELLKKFHNDGNPPLYPFKDHDELANAMHMRASLIETMLKNVTAEMGADSTEPFSLPPEWTPQDDRFVVTPGVTPATAIRSIFGTGKARTRLDCNMMMVAAQYKSMLDALKDENFNQLFPGGAGLIISQVSIVPGEASVHPFFTKGAFKEHVGGATELRIVIDPADPTKDLLPGDWVYFANVAEYEAMAARLSNVYDEIAPTLPRGTDPEKPEEYNTNFWQGEHAVYIGDGKFTGLGFDAPVTYEEMLATLTTKYMDVINAYCNWKYLKYHQMYSSAADCVEEMKAKSAGDKPQLTRVLRLDPSKLSELGK